MAKVKTVTYTFPVWYVDLLISLLMGDGGDGFSDEEIREAQEFLRDEKIFSITGISAPRDDEVDCVLIVKS